jgi:hypothetical protein
MVCDVNVLPWWTHFRQPFFNNVAIVRIALKGGENYDTFCRFEREPRNPAEVFKKFVQGVDVFDVAQCHTNVISTRSSYTEVTILNVYLEHV